MFATTCSPSQPMQLFLLLAVFGALAHGLDFPPTAVTIRYKQLEGYGEMYVEPSFNNPSNSTRNPLYMCSHTHYLVEFDLPANHTGYFAEGSTNGGGSLLPGIPLGPPFVTLEPNVTNPRIILDPRYRPGGQVVYLCDADLAEGGAVSFLGADSDACAGPGGSTGFFPPPVEEEDAGLDEFDEQSGDPTGDTLSDAGLDEGIDDGDDDDEDDEGNGADGFLSWLSVEYLWIGGGITLGALFIIGSVRASTRRAPRREDVVLKTKARRASLNATPLTEDGEDALPDSVAASRNSSFVSIESSGSVPPPPPPATPAPEPPAEEASRSLYDYRPSRRGSDIDCDSDNGDRV